MTTQTSKTSPELGKRRLLERLLEEYGEMLDRARRAMRAAQGEANEHKGRAESRYDTFREEAQYLAGGQARRVQELEDITRALQRFLSDNPNVDRRLDEALPGGLVRVSDESGTEHAYLVLPVGGGLVLDHGGGKVLVVNAGTPLGRALLSRRPGEEARFEVAGKPRVLLILSVD